MPVLPFLRLRAVVTCSCVLHRWSNASSVRWVMDTVRCAMQPPCDTGRLKATWSKAAVRLLPINEGGG
jgi:hypothetical protein